MCVHCLTATERHIGRQLDMYCTKTSIQRWLRQQAISLHQPIYRVYIHSFLTINHHSIHIPYQPPASIVALLSLIRSTRMKSLTLLPFNCQAPTPIQSPPPPTSHPSMYVKYVCSAQFSPSTPLHQPQPQLNPPPIDSLARDLVYVDRV